MSLFSQGRDAPYRKVIVMSSASSWTGMAYPQMYHLESSLRRTSPNVGSVVSDITSVPFSLRASSSSVQRAAITQDDETAVVTVGTLPWQLEKVVAVKMTTKTPFLSRQTQQKVSFQNTSCVRDWSVPLRHSGEALAPTWLYLETGPVQSNKS